MRLSVIAIASTLLSTAVAANVTETDSSLVTVTSCEAECTNGTTPGVTSYEGVAGDNKQYFGAAAGAALVVAGFLGL